MENPAKSGMHTEGPPARRAARLANNTPAIASEGKLAQPILKKRMTGLTIKSISPEWSLPFIQLISEDKCSPSEARRYALELLEQALIAEIDAFLIQEGSDRLPDPKAAVRHLAELRESETRLKIRSTAQVKFLDDSGSHTCSIAEAWALSHALMRATVLAEQEAILSSYAADQLKMPPGEIANILAELEAYRRTPHGDRIPEIGSKKGAGAKVHLGKRFEGIVKGLLQILRLD